MSNLRERRANDRQSIVDACSVALLGAARKTDEIRLPELVEGLRFKNPRWDIPSDDLNDIVRRLAASNAIALRD